MKSQRLETPCHRTPSSKEILRDLAGYDQIEQALLTTARLYFQSFAVPQSQAWVDALSLVTVRFGRTQGPVIGVRLLTAMQSMRCTRRSVFQFSAPDCERCSAVVTEHERRFMKAIQSLRRSKRHEAQLELMLLCEGVACDHVVAAFAELTDILPGENHARMGVGHVAIIR